MKVKDFTQSRGDPLLVYLKLSCSLMVSQICDFGCAKFLDNVAATTLTGTYKWMAPEVNFSLVLFSVIYLNSCHKFPDSEEGASIIPL